MREEEDNQGQVGGMIKEETVGRQWFTPVILAIQEAEIRKIMIQGQPGQIVHETLSGKYVTQKKGLAKWLK
jgi:hypothetical protein